MELLHGRSLHERLQRGDLSVEVSLRICAEVASALATAHAHGLVHRDVKPGNVMLTPGGAKVVDFGLAAVAGERDREEDANVLGTPAYLAPERLNGHPVVAATDVYALGLLLYRLLAGRLPWTAETSTQMLEAHVYLEPAPLPKLPGVPPVVRKLVHRCLAKEPAERPNSSEVTVTLAHAAGHPRAAGQRQRRPRRRLRPGLVVDAQHQRARWARAAGSPPRWSGSRPTTRTPCGSPSTSTPPSTTSTCAGRRACCCAAPSASTWRSGPCSTR